MDLESRINNAIDSGIDTFWVHIRNQFPEAPSGDLSPGTVYDLETWVRKAVEEWVEMNVPKPGAPKGMYYVQRTTVQVAEVLATSGEHALALAQSNWDHPGWLVPLDTEHEYVVLDAAGQVAS